MIRTRAYKTELDPTPAQIDLFLRHAGVARFVWNWGLGRAKEVYDETGKFPTVYALKKELNAIKAEQFPWISEVSTYASQSAFDNLGAGLSNFFREMKKFKAGARSEPPGFPRFKNRDTARKSFRLYGSIHVLNDAVRIPVIGMVKLKEKGYLPVAGVKILNLTISEQGRRWFVALQVEEEVADPPVRPDSPVGVKVNTTKALCDTGEEYELSKAMRKLDRELARLNRERDRRQKGGKNRAKSVVKISRTHYRIACQRRDLLHQATAKITSDHTVITAADMRSKEKLQEVQPFHKRAMAIQDAAWYEFRRQVEYKAGWKGGETIIVDKEEPNRV